MSDDNEIPPEAERRDEQLAIDVAGTIYRVDQPVISGRQVLEIAHKHPVEEYIVYWLGHDNVLQDLGLDRTVHVREHRVSKFYAFEADRSYRFELEGKREDWGAPLITEPTLLKLAGVGADHRVFVREKDTAPRLLNRGEIVDLSQPGIERFHLERVILVTVVNEENGADFPLEGFRETKLRDLFTAMYVELKVIRHANDRLRCEQGGGDAFGYAESTLGEYLEAGHCRCLVWLFAGGTGGAVMPVMMPAAADPAIAAATFRAHLDRLWVGGRPHRLGWMRREIDPLHELVTLPGTRPTGEVDPYYFLLGAEYYDVAPPTARLVEPSTLGYAAQGSRWWPVLEKVPPWFKLHAAYPWPDGRPRQLLCFSMNAEFYMTDHSPQPHELWVQNRHTVAMTLFRLAEILSPAHYRRPAA